MVAEYVSGKFPDQIPCLLYIIKMILADCLLFPLQSNMEAALGYLTRRKLSIKMKSSKYLLKIQRLYIDYLFLQRLLWTFVRVSKVDISFDLLLYIYNLKMSIATSLRKVEKRSVKHSLALLVN